MPDDKKRPLQLAVDHQCKDGPSLVEIEIYPLPTTVDGHGKIRLTAKAAIDLASLLTVHALAADKHSRAEPESRLEKELDAVLQACGTGGTIQ